MHFNKWAEKVKESVKPQSTQNQDECKRPTLLTITEFSAIVSDLFARML